MADPTPADRARWELATLAGRLRTMEAERDDWRRRHDDAVRERDRHRDAERAVRDSRAYRMGRALVALVGPGHRPDGPAPDDGPAPVSAPPAHVYVAVGLSAAALRDLTRVLAQRLVVQPGHRPVVVTDCPQFRVARVPGVLLEYLPDPATWQRHRPDVPWDDLLTDRLTRLFTDHGCTRTVVVDPSAPPGLADLLA